MSDSGQGVCETASQCVRVCVYETAVSLYIRVRVGLADSSDDKEKGRTVNSTCKAVYVCAKADRERMYMIWSRG